MKSSDLTFAIHEWDKKWFQRRRKVVYFCSLKPTFSNLQKGSKGAVFCEKGITPTAPVIMSTMDAGEFSLVENNITIKTVEYELHFQCPVSGEGVIFGELKHKLSKTKVVKLAYWEEE